MRKYDISGCHIEVLRSFLDFPSDISKDIPESLVANQMINDGIRHIFRPTIFPQPSVNIAREMSHSMIGCLRRKLPPDEVAEGVLYVARHGINSIGDRCSLLIGFQGRYVIIANCARG